MTDLDLQHMRRALELARRGLGLVSPNPLVGCVIADASGVVIGEGAYLEFGGPHAEPNAIRDAESRGYSVRGATMYVTLEPHSFQGKTPPCSDLIIEKGIARCVVAMEDPNPKVSGNGIEQLRRAVIEVEVGLMQQDAQELNRFFIKHIRTGHPYVTLKLAMSLDGRSALASGESKWITSEASRRRVHTMRSGHDAVMIGRQTALQDDPELTVRYQAVGRQPWRIILDPGGSLSANLKVFSDADRDRTIAITSEGSHRKDGIQSLAVPASGDRLNLESVFSALGSRGIASVLVEAGPTLAASLIQQELFDELAIFQAPRILGGDARPAVGALELDRLAQAEQLRLHSVTTVEGSYDLEIRLRRQET